MALTVLSLAVVGLIVFVAYIGKKRKASGDSVKGGKPPSRTQPK